MEKIIVLAAAAVCAGFITALVCLILYYAADFVRMLLDRPGSMPQLVWAVVAAAVFAASLLILRKYGFLALDSVHDLIGRVRALFA